MTNGKMKGGSVYIRPRNRVAELDTAWMLAASDEENREPSGDPEGAVDFEWSVGVNPVWKDGSDVHLE